jgi:hypothetical protein
MTIKSKRIQYTGDRKFVAASEISLRSRAAARKCSIRKRTKLQKSQTK